MIPELRTLIAVARYGTFAAAGEHIGLTQSAVSSQIKRLEESLGFELFDRTGRSATLNAAGGMTLARAEEIVALFSRLGELPNDENVSGLLRIGAIASVQSTLLARALVRFRKKFPQLRLRIVPGVSMHLMDQLDAGEIDASIMIRPPLGMLPELTWQSLVHEPFMLVVPGRTKGNDWRQLIQAHPFLRYERTSFGGRMVERFLRSKHLVVQESIELDEIQGMVQMVANGLGVALMPMVEAHLPLPRNVRAISLGEHTFYREIGIVQRVPVVNQPVISQLAQCLRDAAEVGLKPSDSR
ncbi:LysR substrate-binding domain-containing protein [Polaromonas jejuensis]|uniref:LysR substrate-binding domain-containing protein n=1 Tax=Polaromonas jejuensis TaxID=457502 RepID=A0ABW0QEC6_9BURK|nr:LysR substrate-binding domain-containing protein [Polaromonas jejuensis]